jgi:hypothetical protein
LRKPLPQRANLEPREIRHCKQMPRAGTRKREREATPLRRGMAAIVAPGGALKNRVAVCSLSNARPGAFRSGQDAQSFAQPHRGSATTARLEVMKCRS